MPVVEDCTLVLGADRPRSVPIGRAYSRTRRERPAYIGGSLAPWSSVRWRCGSTLRRCGGWFRISCRAGTDFLRAPRDSG